MKHQDIYKRLKENGVVYIVDDYEEVALRLVHGEKETSAYLKRMGRKECVSKVSSELVFNIQNEGREIDKSYYDNF